MSVVAALLSAVVAQSAAPAVAAPTAPAAASARLEIRVLPFADLYFHVRALALKSDPVPDLPGLRGAVDTVRSVGKELTSPLALGPIEGALAGCATGAQALEVAAKLPQSFEPRPGYRVDVRKLGTTLVQAVAKAEPAFLEKIWPEHLREIDAARERIDETFMPRSGECLAYVAKHLCLAPDGLAPGDLVIPVCLVADMPFPGAVTQRDEDDRGVCFVAVRGAPGTQLFETILHEATHALDVATSRAPATDPTATDAASADAASTGTSTGASSVAAPPSVLDDLRARLETAGIARKDRAWRDVPHTLMFVQAGETIRRIVDPRHEHYGTVARYYAKVQAIADVELPAWIAVLDGKSTRDEALARIVAAVEATPGSR